MSECCPIDDFPFETKKNVEKKYFCEVCGKDFETKRGMKIHRTQVHGTNVLGKYSGRND